MLPYLTPNKHHDFEAKNVRRATTGWRMIVPYHARMNQPQYLALYVLRVLQGTTQKKIRRVLDWI